MPYFEYTARDKTGKTLKRQLFAQSKEHLVVNLQREGLLLLSVREAAAVAESISIRMHKKAKVGDLILFSKELAVLLENGIPIMEAIDVLTKQMSSTNLINACKAIRKDLENGSTLSNAIAKNRLVFSPLWQYMTEAGELSGQLPFVMRQMAIYLEAQESIRKKTMTAMLYPAILFSAAVVAVFLFAFKIIPIFRDVYASFGAASTLPPLTNFIIMMSDAVTRYYMVIIIFLVISFMIFKQAISTKLGRQLFERVLLKSPVLGDLYKALSIERFATSLKVLLKSGIPIVKAIEMASSTSNSVIFAGKIEEAKNKVIAGLPFSDAMQQTALFPPLTIQLVCVAERTGNYSGMFEEIANYYKDVLDNAIAVFTAMIEPVMLVFMGIVIGTLIIGMYLPIFGLAKL